jgi:hypothetical protein
MGIEN